MENIPPFQPMADMADKFLRTIAQLLNKKAIRLSRMALVENIGFEPMTPTLPAWCSSQLS